MDIPAPKRNETSDETPQQDSKASVKSSQKLSEVNKENAKQSSDEALAKVAELLQSKEYHLPIREKRSRPLLTFALLPKRTKKSKRKQLSEPTENTSKKKPTKKSARMQLVVLLVIVVGLVVAIDAGWLSLGFELPFDFIKQ